MRNYLWSDLQNDNDLTNFAKLSNYFERMDKAKERNIPGKD